jgi:hypothetical protein
MWIAEDWKFVPHGINQRKRYHLPRKEILCVKQPDIHGVARRDSPALPFRGRKTEDGASDHFESTRKHDNSEHHPC